MNIRTDFKFLGTWVLMKIFFISSCLLILTPAQADPCHVRSRLRQMVGHSRSPAPQILTDTERSQLGEITNVGTDGRTVAHVNDLPLSTMVRNTENSERLFYQARERLVKALNDKDLPAVEAALVQMRRLESEVESNWNAAMQRASQSSSPRDNSLRSQIQARVERMENSGQSLQEPIEQLRILRGIEPRLAHQPSVIPVSLTDRARNAIRQLTQSRENADQVLSQLGFVKDSQAPASIHVYRHSGGAEIVFPSTGPLSLNSELNQAIQNVLVQRSGQFVHPQVPASARATLNRTVAHVSDTHLLTMLRNTETSERLFNQSAARLRAGLDEGNLQEVESALLQMRRYEAEVESNLNAASQKTTQASPPEDIARRVEIEGRAVRMDNVAESFEESVQQLRITRGAVPKLSHQPMNGLEIARGASRNELRTNDAILAGASEIRTPEQRIGGAETVLGRSLQGKKAESQRAAIIRAHEVAPDKAYGEHSLSELREKSSILRYGMNTEELAAFRRSHNNHFPRQIFNAQDANTLVRSGVTGKSNLFGRSVLQRTVARFRQPSEARAIVRSLGRNTRNDIETLRSFGVKPVLQSDDGQFIVYLASDVHRSSFTVKAGRYFVPGNLEGDRIADILVNSLRNQPNIAPPLSSPGVQQALKDFEVHTRFMQTRYEPNEIDNLLAQLVPESDDFTIVTSMNTSISYTIRHSNGSEITFPTGAGDRKFAMDNMTLEQAREYRDIIELRKTGKLNFVPPESRHLAVVNPAPLPQRVLSRQEKKTLTQSILAEGKVEEETMLSFGFQVHDRTDVSITYLNPNTKATAILPHGKNSMPEPEARAALADVLNSSQQRHFSYHVPFEVKKSDTVLYAKKIWRVHEVKGEYVFIRQAHWEQAVRVKKTDLVRSVKELGDLKLYSYVIHRGHEAKVREIFSDGTVHFEELTEFSSPDTWMGRFNETVAYVDSYQGLQKGQTVIANGVERKITNIGADGTLVFSPRFQHADFGKASEVQRIPAALPKP